MLDLLLSKDLGESKLVELEGRLKGTIKSHIASFTRDSMLKRFQSSEDLYNIALMKLDEAIKNFVCNPELTDYYNERRFLAMLRKYIKNALIDEQYGANVEKRKPKGTITSLSAEPDSEDEGYFIQIPDDSMRPERIASVNEIIALVGSSLEPEEKVVLGYLCEGYPAEKIAGKVGQNISRIRYIIYEKIQPNALKYL